MERRESVWAWDGGAMGHDTDAYSTSTAASAAPAWAAAAAADAQALPSPTASDVGARLRAAQAADRARARAARMPKAQQVAKHSDQYSASVSATVDLWAATAPGASHEAATQSHAKGVVSARLRAESFKDRGRRPPPGGGRDAGGGNRRGARGKRRRWISGQELLNSTVLSKSLAELATAPTNVPSTPARFESLVQYYGTLQLLVLEEARSIVAQGLESRPLATFTMLRVNNPGDADAASLRELRSLQFNPTRSLDSEQRSTMRPGSVFLLHPQCQSQARGTTAEEYIAIVDGRSGNSDDGSLTFETMPDGSWADALGDEQAVWSAQALDASLLLTQRMCDLCQRKPNPLFAHSLLGGSDREHIRFDSSGDDEEEEEEEKEVDEGDGAGAAAGGADDAPAGTGTGGGGDAATSQMLAQMLQGLNASQRTSVTEFASCSNQLCLLQGPPGTGKTTALVALLSILDTHKDERTLVCAPSNRALHEILIRFLAARPSASIILAGDKDKLPEETVEPGGANGLPGPVERRTIHDVFCYSFADRWAASLEGVLRGLEVAEQLRCAPGSSAASAARVATTDPRQCFERAAAAVGSLQRRFDLSAPQMYKLHLKAKAGTAMASLAAALSGVDELERDADGGSGGGSAAAEPEWLSGGSSEPASELQEAALAGSAALRTLHGALKKLGGGSHFAKQLTEELLSHADFVFCTLSVSGSFVIKTMAKVHVLVVDEAAQAVESETLLPLGCEPKKCLLVGDPQQLCATVQSAAAAKAGFTRSLMQRLMTDCHRQHGFLDTQYRMHPSIALFPAQRFYGGRLKTAASTARGGGFFRWVDVQGAEHGGRGVSFRNDAEAKAICIALALLASRAGVDLVRSVRILTFYSAQMRAIKAAVRRCGLPGGIRVSTVDGSQGAESDYVLLSMVRANSRGNIGFVDEFRRLNVAITRARIGLLAFGHAATCERSRAREAGRDEPSDVSMLVASARQRNLVARDVSQLEWDKCLD